MQVYETTRSLFRLSPKTRIEIGSCCHSIGVQFLGLDGPVVDTQELLEVDTEWSEQNHSGSRHNKHSREAARHMVTVSAKLDPVPFKERCASALLVFG